MVRSRRIVIAIALVIAAAASCALLLPSDATQGVLDLRGRVGRGHTIAGRREGRSTVREIALRNDRGETLTTAWVRRPLALACDYRIVLTYAGADTGEAMLQLIPARDDLVVVAMQYPWKPPHTLIGRLRAIYDMRQAAYRTIAGGIAAVDWLARDEHLDTTRVLLLGASLGSIFATIDGAIDQRVKQVVLVHGGAALPDTLAAEAPTLPQWMRTPLAHVAAIPVETFDPAHYVDRIAPRRLVMIAARDDWRFPPQAVRAFFDRARQPKDLRWTNTGHVGKRNIAVVNAVIAVLDTEYGFVGEREKEPCGDRSQISSQPTGSAKAAASSFAVRSRQATSSTPIPSSSSTKWDR